MKLLQEDTAKAGKIHLKRAAPVAHCELEEEGFPSVKQPRVGSMTAGPEQLPEEVRVSEDMAETDCGTGEDESSHEQVGQDQITFFGPKEFWESWIDSPCGDRHWPEADRRALAAEGRQKKQESGHVQEAVPEEHDAQVVLKLRYVDDYVELRVSNFDEEQFGE